MKKALIFAAIFSIGLFTFASGAKKISGSVKAKPSIECEVKDKSTGESLTGVAIYVDNKLKGYTDLDGKFEIKDLSKGKYVISTNFVSYKIAKKEVEFSENNNLKLDLEEVE